VARELKYVIMYSKKKFIFFWRIL